MTTPLRESLDQLLALQKIDSDIDKLTRTKARLDNGAGHAASAAETLSASRAAASHFAALSGTQKDAELEQAGIETKIKSYEHKMSSGQLTNAREIASIERELNQLNRQRASLDDKILNLMEQVEAARTEVSASDERHAQAEQATSTQKQSYRADFDNLTAELIRKNEERASALAAVTDPALLKRYESLRARPSHNGIAIARIYERHCSACHNQVSTQDEEHVKEAGQIVFCESCGRILG